MLTLLMMMLIDRPHHKRDGRKSERNHRKEKKITFPWKGQIKCQLNDERRKNRQSNQPRSEYPMNDGPREQQTLRCIYWESVRSTTIACRRLSRCESFFFGRHRSLSDHWLIEADIDIPVILTWNLLFAFWSHHKRGTSCPAATHSSGRYFA